MKGRSGGFTAGVVKLTGVVCLELRGGVAFVGGYFCDSGLIGLWKEWCIVYYSITKPRRSTKVKLKIVVLVYFIGSVSVGKWCSEPSLVENIWSEGGGEGIFINTKPYVAILIA